AVVPFYGLQNGFATVERQDDESGVIRALVDDLSYAREWFEINCTHSAIAFLDCGLQTDRIHDCSGGLPSPLTSKFYRPNMQLHNDYMIHKSTAFLPSSGSFSTCRLRQYEN
ncbi:hypothetical protein HAX54_003626, partial [Datura stramonium]|nr:hypothetical protein [Datura stramonium]